MKTRIYARVVAKPITFPDVIEVWCGCLDDEDKPTGEGYGGIRFTWEQVQNHFWIGPAHARECESILSRGDAVALKDCFVNGRFYEKGEAMPVEESKK